MGNKDAELDNLITALSEIVVTKVNHEKGLVSDFQYEEAKRVFKTYHDIYIHNRIQSILNNQNLRARLSNSINKNEEKQIEKKEKLKNPKDNIIFD